MIRRFGVLGGCCAAMLLLNGAASSEQVIGTPAPPVAAPTEAAAAAVPAPAPVKPAPPPPPTPQQALEHGVLIVVSLPTQRMFVFRDGALWDSAPVSTGRRGHGTPVGTFPILQKAVHHRSNIYSNAPMPYMQRLTWGGIALHGGHLPGYRASHGCIRVPHAFARKLYAITDMRSTAVLVTGDRVASASGALALAAGAPPAAAERVELAAAAAPAPPLGTAVPTRPAAAALPPAAGVRVQTIQLTAAQSPGNAAAYWQELVQRRPQLASLEHAIVPAIVASRQFYRLRATGAGAAAICSGLVSSGVPCLQVSG